MACFDFSLKGEGNSRAILEIRFPSCSPLSNIREKQQGDTNRMLEYIKSLTGRMKREEEGATLVEYVLLVSLIGVAAVVGITSFGGGRLVSLNASANRMP